MNIKILGSIILILTSGCASTSGGVSGPGLIGNNRNTSYSLKETREANKLIKYTEEIPAGAEIIGDFTVRRCHRMATDPVPSKSTLINDLKLAAYSQGADGVSGFKLKKHFSILYNCWQLRDATATFYKINKK